MFLYALIAAGIVTLLSLIGVFFFGKGDRFSFVHHYILPVAVGVFLGVVFVELIPETIAASPEFGPLTILFGFFAFYLLSHYLRSFHHHHPVEKDTCAQNGAKMLLVGDTIHNLADGIVIATAFMLDPWVGVLTTVGIALHEIPQEIAEFGVLIKSGCTRVRAALYNLASASSVIAGVVITFLVANQLGNYVYTITGIAAGNLLYIATTDLIPELRESHHKHFMQSFAATILGTIIIIATINLGHELGGSH
jgi:zinc and cadmium transporter